MIKRILSSLEERRRNLKDEDKGFTLIELLVVVIIIGILVAIAIPVYIGLQNGAKVASLDSDLKNGQIAVIAYYAEQSTPAASTTNTVPYGFVQSPGNVLAITGTSASAYCVSGTRTDPSTTKHIDQDGVLENGPC
ncbi:prepilin-type N-terminal cleavage/methylation domain-containing protein [Agromyces aureus]|uniref:Prepilin-type N-terminal cleavage/methylation domain-containing protein n=1 Tax=Agromyces aureus TaxID=453304 RepID=A0A191WIB3_9MICO|nr:prepilin-type N-terminal cleavage/methylation domain-containing protein [Agromyces aureus]ANJ27908.1 hypothetical protein ATC03_15470 [Agromyces aureus]